MKHVILFNPHAGNGTGEQDVKKLSLRYGDNCCIQDITKIDNYQSFLASLTEEDALVLCGGDGTLNRFINDTEGITIPCDVLYYALGSGNDFLHDLEKPVGSDPISIKNYIKDLPCVEINGKLYRFLNNVGFGIDGYCCEVGDQLKAKATKAINYTAIAIKGLLFHYRPTNATVVVDGETFEYKKVWLAPTMKGRFYGGGMMPTPSQDRNDPEGTLSLLLFYRSGRIRTLMAFPSIFKGKHIKHTSIVKIHTGKEISVTFDAPAAVQIDGETFVGVTSYRAMAKHPSIIAQ